MADSRRERILLAIIATLDAAGKPAGLLVHRSRTRPIEKDELPAMVAYLLAETAKRKGGEWGPVYQHAMRVRVECRQAGAPPDRELDPLATWAVKALVGNQTLGGEATSVEYVEAQWDAEEANKVLAGAALDFVVAYETTAADPEA